MSGSGVRWNGGETGRHLPCHPLGGARGVRHADDRREGARLGPVELDLACRIRPRLLRDRDDGAPLAALRHRPLRLRGLPLVAPSGRPDDRVRPGGAQDGAGAAPGVRPDAAAQVGDGDGRLLQLGRHVRQLRDPAGRGQDRPRRRAYPRLPAAAGGGDRRPAPGPAEDPGRRRTRLRAGEVEGVTANQLARAISSHVRGAVVSHSKGIDMPTVVVRSDKLLDVCRYLRDEQGKNFLSAVSAVDFLGYGENVSGYFGTERGRDLNATGTW